MDGTDRQSTEEAASVTLPWHESAERELKDMAASAVIVVLAAFAVVGLLNVVRGLPGSHLASAIMALFLIGMALMSWYGPFGTVGRESSVDRHGLVVRHRGWRLRPTEKIIELSPRRYLPAHQIGTIEVVEEEKRRRMWRRSMALSYRGRRLGWTRTTIDKETTRAVFIEQTEAGLKRPWWLLRCSDCDALAAALRLARAGSTTVDDS